MVEEETKQAELALASAGQVLRQAREAAGLGIDDIAARTRIASRHLMAIEEDRFADLASRTYAVGFSRTYARALGLNEKSIADQVGAQMDALGETRAGAHVENFEPGDPARVPSSSLAWIAALIGIALLVGLYFFRGSFLSPASEMPSLIGPEKPAPDVRTAPVQSSAAAPAALPVGAVAITAQEGQIWVWVDDAAGNQLFQKEMTLNERYVIPSGNKGVTISTARPDVLQITVGGKPVARLSDRPEIIRKASLDPANLVRRQAPNFPDSNVPTVARQSPTPSP